EAFHRVVGHVFLQRYGGRVRARGRGADGVAVGRRFRHRIGADRAAGPGPVLHHGRLAERVAEPCRDRARGEIRAAAGREGHDELERLGRPGLRENSTGKKDESKNNCSHDLAFGYITASPCWNMVSISAFVRYSGLRPCSAASCSARMLRFTSPTSTLVRP